MVQRGGRRATGRRDGRAAVGRDVIGADDGVISITTVVGIVSRVTARAVSTSGATDRDAFGERAPRGVARIARAYRARSVSGNRRAAAVFSGVITARSKLRSRRRRGHRGAARRLDCQRLGSERDNASPARPPARRSPVSNRARQRFDAHRTATRARNPRSVDRRVRGVHGGAQVLSAFCRYFETPRCPNTGGPTRTPIRSAQHRFPFSFSVFLPRTLPPRGNAVVRRKTNRHELPPPVTSRNGSRSHARRWRPRASEETNNVCATAFFRRVSHGRGKPVSGTRFPPRNTRTHGFCRRDDVTGDAMRGRRRVDRALADGNATVSIARVRRGLAGSTRTRCTRCLQPRSRFPTPERKRVNVHRPYPSPAYNHKHIHGFRSLSGPRGSSRHQARSCNCCRSFPCRFP